MVILDIIAGLIAAIGAMNGQVDTLIHMDNYTKFQMADSCYIEVLNYKDSCLVVETVCAPICSSCARVYNKEWKVMRTISSPYPHAIFPLAHIEDGKLLWADNTSEILDDEERK